MWISSKYSYIQNFPSGSSGKEPSCQCRRHKRCGSYPWVRKITLEEGTATHSSILAWRIPGTEEPGGYSPQGGQESDTTEATQHACMHTYVPSLLNFPPTLHPPALFMVFFSIILHVVYWTSFCNNFFHLKWWFCNLGTLTHRTHVHSYRTLHSISTPVFMYFLLLMPIAFSSFSVLWTKLK